jgi:hypothetical protein
MALTLAREGTAEAMSTGQDLRLVLTPGQASDKTTFPLLIEGLPLARDVVLIAQSPTVGHDTVRVPATKVDVRN